jgi:CelD/BcsL family acetyltransferase involved in cellulose biosynthesis
LKLRILENINSLIESAAAWNELWQRSDTTSPSARAEQIAHWVETFSPEAAFRALAVEDAGKLVAAIPLVGRRVKKVLNVGALPLNEWTSGGDLLLDPTCDVASALDLIARAAVQSRWPLVWCDEVPREEARWQQFAAALSRAGWSVDLRDQGRVGQVVIGHDWAAYEATLNGDFRRTRRRYAKRLEDEAPTELAVIRPTSAAEVDALVRRVFEVEDRSWKGREGTSVLKNAGMLEFYQRQGRLLAEQGQLEIVLLQHSDDSIAAAYVWAAKGVRFLAKLGYDEEYRRFGPGQHLVLRYLQHLHEDADCRVLDFWGRLVPWNQDWSNRVYTTARLVAAPPRILSRGLFFAYSRLGRRRDAANVAADVSA